MVFQKSQKQKVFKAAKNKQRSNFICSSFEGVCLSVFVSQLFVESLVLLGLLIHPLVIF